MHKRRSYYIKNRQKGLHAHHIIPRHAGGTDDPSNIIFLTVEQHAEAHRLLFEQYGRWQDKLAWQMLSGMLGNEDAIRIAQQNGDKTWMKTPEGRAIMKEAWRRSKELGHRRDPWNKGQTKHTDERLKQASERAAEHQKLGKIKCIGDSMRGKEFDDSHKAKLAERARNRSKIECPHCKAQVIKQMFVRWHGDKCSRKCE